MNAKLAADVIIENMVYTRDDIDHVADTLGIELTDEIQDMVFTEIEQCRDCGYYFNECTHSWGLCEECESIRESELVDDNN